MNAVETPTAVADTFRNAFLSEESGTLRVYGARTTFALHFDRGMISGADLEGEGVGTIPDGNQGVKRIVELAFAAIPESVEFQPATSPMAESQADILRTVDLFLAGVRSMTGFEAIHEALLAMDQRMLLRPNPSVPLERLTLQPIHGYILSRLAGRLTFSELSATVGPDDESEAGRFVFGLLLLGSVALDPPLGHATMRTAQLLADHRRDTAREESETALIRETFESVKSRNPYQIVGASETWSLEDIRAAYESRRGAMAADRFLQKVRDRMRKELSIIDARLTEAYMALQSGQYERAAATTPAAESLDMEQLSLRRELTKTEVETTLSEQEKLAESYYAKAKKYFSQADYHNCIQFCTHAIRQSSQTARYHFLMGEAQARNPDRRWQKMAEQSFLTASKLDPWNVDYLLVLGRFYKKQGFASRARRQFERAIEIQPGHERAMEELVSLDPV